MVSKQFFIIGSGFSKDFDDRFPLLNNLTQMILEECDDELVRNYVNNLPIALQENTESLFSYLYSELPWKDPAEMHINRGIFFKLSYALIRLFNNLEKEIKWGHNHLQKLTNYWSEKKSILISFNYDTLIEKMNGGKGYYQCDLTSVKNPGRKYSSLDTFKLFKLHGSINWYYSGSLDTVSEPIKLVPFRENDSSELDREGLFPVIIPPLLQKDGFYQNIVLKSQWLKLAELLNANEEELEFYFMGYSFPPSDFLVNNLFQSHVRKEKKYKIYLANVFDFDENGELNLKSKQMIENYFFIFSAGNTQMSKSFYSDLFKQGFCEVGNLILDINLSKISHLAKKAITWNKTSSTIENVFNHLNSRENN